MAMAKGGTMGGILGGNRNLRDFVGNIGTAARDMSEMSDASRGLASSLLTSTRHALRMTIMLKQSKAALLLMAGRGALMLAKHGFAFAKTTAQAVKDLKSGKKSAGDLADELRKAAQNALKTAQETVKSRESLAGAAKGGASRLASQFDAALGSIRGIGRSIVGAAAGVGALVLGWKAASGAVQEYFARVSRAQEKIAEMTAAMASLSGQGGNQAQLARRSKTINSAAAGLLTVDESSTVYNEITKVAPGASDYALNAAFKATAKADLIGLSADPRTTGSLMSAGVSGREAASISALGDATGMSGQLGSVASTLRNRLNGSEADEAARMLRAAMESGDPRTLQQVRTVIEAYIAGGQQGTLKSFAAGRGRSLAGTTRGERQAYGQVLTGGETSAANQIDSRVRTAMSDPEVARAMASQVTQAAGDRAEFYRYRSAATDEASQQAYRQYQRHTRDDFQGWLLDNSNWFANPDIQAEFRPGYQQNIDATNRALMEGGMGIVTDRSELGRMVNALEQMSGGQFAFDPDANRPQ